MALTSNSTKAALGLLSLVCVLASIGCERRQYYRNQADREVDCIIQTASQDPRWSMPGVQVTMDPRSRYYDPNNVDCPPMPLDDPASHRYMHCVNGMKGYKNWHVNGVTSQIENPTWRDRLGEYVPLTPDGKVLLSLDSALTLAYVNSPTYQSQIETLYLSALDVSAERFRLQTQFFGGDSITYSHQGKDNFGGERNTLTNSLDFQARRRTAVAGEILVGFANSFVWQFTGNDTNATVSILNFNLVQPLLRSGGRVIALEQLTIVERALLANLRAFQRYRQGFYTSIAVGNLGVSGPQRRGGFFGGTGLTGFTGTGSGGLGGVGQATNFARGGLNNGGGGGGAGGLAGGGAGSVGGYIGLLQTLQEFRNAQDSFDLQLRSLGLLEANLEAGLIDITQVDQFRQSIETQRAQLLQSGIGLENSIESYLVSSLGLPPDLPVELDDSIIRPFQLVAPEITQLQNQLNGLQDRIGGLPATASKADVDPIMTDIDALRQATQDYFNVIRADLEKMEAALPMRRKALTEKELVQFETERQKLIEELAALAQRVDNATPEFAKIRTDVSDENIQESLDKTVVWLRMFQGLMQETSLIQARVRLEAVVIDPIFLEPETALSIAIANRLDLMNNRASLVDSWRLIAYNANSLLSDVDVRVSGDISSVGDNPVKFQSPTGRMSLGLEFDAPFTRLLERNNYRQALIDYQADRRQLIQFYDSINQTTRNTLRQLEQLRVNLEIQRRAVGISIRRVDSTQAELNKPLPTPVPGQGPPQLGPTAVQNLLSALNDLRNTQNNFMSVWLNYYATRMVLLRELGIMEIDDYGRWVDGTVDFEAYLPTEPVELPPAIPQEWMDREFPNGIPQAEEVEPQMNGPAGSGGPQTQVRGTQNFVSQNGQPQRRTNGYNRVAPSIEPEKPMLADQPRPLFSNIVPDGTSAAPSETDVSRMAKQPEYSQTPYSSSRR